MAAGNNGSHHYRKTLYGALKDSTKVGLAKVNSENKDLDIAVVKATNHFEVPPKEKHVRTIFEALSRPKSSFAYCMHALAKRLAKTSTWTVALKTLIIIHRALREMVPPIHQELVSYNQSRVLVLNMSHFKDESTPDAWYYSSWVRCYALYLEERLESFRIMNYDVVKDNRRIKQLGIPDLLVQLSALQELLFRLLSCQPDGVIKHNSLIQYTLSTVAAESVQIYAAINAGNFKLADKFFEMQRQEAVRALEIYRKATAQAEDLSEFYKICRGLEFGLCQNYIRIDHPPASFLKAMTEYVKEAPQSSVLPRKGNSDGSSTPSRDTASSTPDFRTPLPRSFHRSDGTSTPPRNSASSEPDPRTPSRNSASSEPDPRTPDRYSASSAADFRTPLPPSFYRLCESDDVDDTTLTSASTFSFPAVQEQGGHGGKKSPTSEVANLVDLDNCTQESSKMNDGSALVPEIPNSDYLSSSFTFSSPSSHSPSHEHELVATPRTSGVSVDGSEVVLTSSVFRNLVLYRL
ncbi:putative clathrin assembly protein [Heracleum sosnowskyi]|uniref:Clathrin assembly protein n=1 Tax=Heracleum sosnowskyi TaxID=360622 RepID=A0AAD8JJ09_9APIA|nr:putative clathrin assembly protein [Heracleum sosnowskyi]